MVNQSLQTLNQDKSCFCQMGQNQSNPFKQNQQPVHDPQFSQHLLHPNQHKIQFIKRVPKNSTTNPKQPQPSSNNNTSLFYPNIPQSSPINLQTRPTNHNQPPNKTIHLSPPKQQASLLLQTNSFIKPALIARNWPISNNKNMGDHSGTHPDLNHLFRTQYVVPQAFKEMKSDSEWQYGDGVDKGKSMSRQPVRNDQKEYLSLNRKEQLKVSNSEPMPFQKTSSQYNQHYNHQQLYQHHNTPYPATLNTPYTALNYAHFPPHFHQFIQPTHSINYEITKGEVLNALPLSSQTFQIQQGASSPEQHLQSTAEYVQEQFKVGSRYIGYKLKGLRHGKGTFYYQDGGCYEGEWSNNKMEGRGTLYYQSGKVAYEGQWINDQFHGKGKLYNETAAPLTNHFKYHNFDDIDEYWQFYEGDFMEDLKNGNGRLKFSNGEVFEGTFKEDMVQGQGYFYGGSGQVVHGIWRQNYLQQLVN